MYTILYNKHDHSCRTWLEDNKEQYSLYPHQLVEWYDDQDQWVENGGTLEISAFPTVITTTGYILRLPENWSAVLSSEQLSVEPGAEQQPET